MYFGSFFFSFFSIRGLSSSLLSVASVHRVSVVPCHPNTFKVFHVAPPLTIRVKGTSFISSPVILVKVLLFSVVLPLSSFTLSSQTSGAEEAPQCRRFVSVG
uniref:Putative secreted protein n=1 Tax=Amblyomma americanum TaxID=6943 RepID=A0A0C9S3G6_AMBAM